MAGAGLLLLLWGAPEIHAESTPGYREAAIAEMRAQLAEFGRLRVEREAGRYPPQDRPKGFVHRDEEIRVGLINDIRPILLEAIDRVVHQGTREEQIGAWGIYNQLLYHHEIERREDYHPILVERLARDDLTIRPYTGTMIATIVQYPSRTTLKSLIELAERTPKLRERYQTLANTATMLGADLQVSQETTDAQLQKILADFLDYLHQNQDKIRFDRSGRAHLPGGPKEGKPKSLSAEDRRRVREDPVCVLRLLHESFVETTATRPFEELVDHCGEALYGVKGVALMKELAAVPDDEVPSIDLEMRLASVYATHPMNDAAILAASYVAAYRREPELQKMAVDVMEIVGGVDRVDKVTRGEPREVREAGTELVRRLTHR